MTLFGICFIEVFPVEALISQLRYIIFVLYCIQVVLYLSAHLLMFSHVYFCAVSSRVVTIP